MTYKEYKKAVASRRGISLYLLEKGIKTGAFQINTSAHELRFLQTSCGYPKYYVEDIIKEKIAEDAQYLELIIKNISWWENGKMHHGSRCEWSQSELVSKLKPVE